MINLIPPEGKSYVRREYALRVFGVWALLLAASISVVAVMLIPTHVLLLKRLEAVSLAYDKFAHDDESTYRDAEQAIQTANRLAERLNRAGAYALPSEVWSEIDAAQSGQITVRSFVYQYKDDNSFDIQVAGIATTRGSLIAFRDALERSPLFVSATVPVSHLAKDVDVPFTMTLTALSGQQKP